MPVDYNEAIRYIPMLPMRGMVVFPQMLQTFDVERPASIGAINNAMQSDQLIFLVGQSNLNADAPELNDLYTVGTVCRIRQQLRQPRGGMCRVMVEGIYRAEMVNLTADPKGYVAGIVKRESANERISQVKMEALVRKCVSLFEEYIRLSPDMLPEQLLSLLADPGAEHVVSYIAQYTQLRAEDKQSILEEDRISRRLTLLIRLLDNELNILNVQRELGEATQEALNQNQREYYLREEMKIIQSELGEDGGSDIGTYREKIEALKCSDEIKEKLKGEVGKLAKQPFGSAEAAVIRSYLDTCLEIPWGVYTKETVDVKKARKILDDDHYGLDKVKDRIIEYLAVKQLSPQVKGGLICLVGPPGTGKTSIAMSVARATNRKLVRISLGGVHDEAEIRGHRKTYIGSMPGRIINGIIQAKSCNPLMVLDEVDKLGSDYRGDPSAALLEALDGEQNSSFRDNFLELPFDLSEVFFITTANSLDTIPRPLLDRMEVIELSSYTDEEKLQIAKRHLLPKQRKRHGLKASELKVSDDAIRAIISGYTSESGVRLLERELARLCRKTASLIAHGEAKSVSVTPAKLESMLGVRKFKDEKPRLRDEVGLVRGLAYTSVGGAMLDVEVAVLDGTGKLELTGNLGDVMKESAHAAVTYLRSRATKFGIDPDFYKNKDIHIHFPEGAVPKDGPSAGITVCTAVLSALTGEPVRRDIAMTGEITIRGRVLPIGGLKEKTMAAYKAGIKTVIIPEDNLSDLEEIDQTVRKGLNFLPVEHMDQVAEAVLVRPLSAPELKTPLVRATGEHIGLRQ